MLRNALIDKLEMYDLLSARLDPQLRLRRPHAPQQFIGRLAAYKANFQYVNVGAASFANVDWPQAAEAGGAAEDEGGTVPWNSCNKKRALPLEEGAQTKTRDTEKWGMQVKSPVVFNPRCPCTAHSESAILASKSKRTAVFLFCLVPRLACLT